VVVQPEGYGTQTVSPPNPLAKGRLPLGTPCRKAVSKHLGFYAIARSGKV